VNHRHANTQKRRSASQIRGRDCRRRSTTSCCRKQTFSTIKDARDLKQATIAQPTHRNTGPSPCLSEKQEMAAAHGQPESFVIEILRPTAKDMPPAIGAATRMTQLLPKFPALDDGS